MRSRSGAGVVLIIVLVLLCIISIVVMGRSQFSSFVSDRASKGVYGDLALLIAKNALTEAHFRLGKLANSPENAFYSEIRQNYSSFESQISLSKLPALGAELEKKPSFKLINSSVDLDVLFQFSSSKELPQPYDRHGSIRLSVSVYHELTGVIRRLSETYDFKLSLVTPPRFFDTYTFFVADGVFLVNSHALEDDANDNIDGALKRIDELEERNLSLQSKIEQAIEALERAKSEAMTGISQYTAAINEARKSKTILSKYEDKWPKIEVADYGENTTGKTNILHHFPAPPICLYSYAPEIDLYDVNLPLKLSKRLESIKAAEQEFKVASMACHDFLETKPSNLSPLPQLIENYCESALKVSNCYGDMLIEDYKAFQDELIEVGGTSYSEFIPFFKQFSKNDYLRKATVVLEEKDGSSTATIGSASSQFSKFFREHEAFSGVLYIHNPNSTLQINHEFKGKMVIVVDGDVSINSLTIDDKRKDLVTLISFGSMTLNSNSKVQASLIPWMTLDMEPGTVIEGNIIFSRLNFISTAPERVLAAKLERDERILAGRENGTFYKSRLHFSMSPSKNFVRIERH